MMSIRLAIVVVVALSTFTMVLGAETKDSEPWVKCETTKGPLAIEMRPDWAPLGVERFLQLVDDKYFDGAPFFRAVDNFLTQFGIAADPALTKKWKSKEALKDDPKRPDLDEGVLANGKFPKYGLAFAGSGPNSRSTELFITKAVGVVGTMPWETQLGNVISGTEAIDGLYTGYGDVAAFNPKGVDQRQLEEGGSGYIQKNFPKLDLFKTCVLTDIAKKYLSEPDSRAPIPPVPVKATIVIKNQSQKAVDLFWIVPDEIRKKHPDAPEFHPVGRLATGGQEEHVSTVGHRFAVKAQEKGQAPKPENPTLIEFLVSADQKDYVYLGDEDEGEKIEL